MVAIGGVYNISGSELNSYSMTITIDSPNGFYFESISNPGARRPFKLYAVIKGSCDRNMNQPGTNSYEHSVALLEEGSNNRGSVQYSGERRGNYYYLWFDLVLCLPYDDWDSGNGDSYVSSNGRMMYNGRYYDLVEADDYSAVITVTVEWGDKSKSISIPLSGYYSKNLNEETVDNTASLAVRPRPSASNLSINSMAGVEVEVADISFMADIKYRSPEYYEGSRQDDGWVWEYSVPKNFYIFLSASRNPNDSDPNGFRLIHTQAASKTDPDINEFIGFDLLLRTNDSSGSIVDTEFDGTESISGGNLPDNSVVVPTSDSTPVEYFDGWSSIWGLGYTWNFNFDTPNDFNKDFNYTGDIVNYAFYDGTISIRMDQPSVNPMRAGRYEEEVYVHIVTDGE